MTDDRLYMSATLASLEQPLVYRHTEQSDRESAVFATTHGVVTSRAKRVR